MPIGDVDDIVDPTAATYSRASPASALIDIATWVVSAKRLSNKSHFESPGCRQIGASPPGKTQARSGDCLFLDQREALPIQGRVYYMCSMVSKIVRATLEKVTTMLIASSDNPSY